MSDVPMVPVDTGFVDEIALSSPPAQTTANAATALTFASGIRHLYLHNWSASDVNYETGGQTATAGSPKLPANGGGIYLDFQNKFTAISVYCAGAVNINGSTANNLIVKGWS